MLIVVAIVVLLAGITYPALAGGINSLRLNTAARTVASFANLSVSRAERFQDTVELIISAKDNSLEARAVKGAFQEKIQLGPDVRIAKILPDDGLGAEDAQVRTFMVYPGGAPPSFGVELENRDAHRRKVVLDPITGAPTITAVQAPPPGS